MVNRYLIAAFLAIPVLNVIFYFLAQRKAGQPIQAEDVTIGIVGVIFAALLIWYAVRHGRFGKRS